MKDPYFIIDFRKDQCHFYKPFKFLNFLMSILLIQVILQSLESSSPISDGSKQDDMAVQNVLRKKMNLFHVLKTFLPSPFVTATIHLLLWSIAKSVNMNIHLTDLHSCFFLQINYEHL